MLARHTAYAEAGGGLAREIPLDDLDPAAMLDWTDEQIARAEHGGLLAMLAREHWPAVISSPSEDGEGDRVTPGGGVTDKATASALSTPSDGTDGKCQLRELRRLFRLYWPAEDEP